jgi:hypothetical protein
VAAPMSARNMAMTTTAMRRSGVFIARPPATR